VSCTCLSNDVGVEDLGRKRPASSTACVGAMPRHWPCGLYLVMLDARRHELLYRYLYRTVLIYTLMAIAVLLVFGSSGCC